MRIARNGTARRIGLGSAAVVSGIALVAGGLGAANAAPGPSTPAISPGSGPVGTTIKVTGTCGESPGGGWTNVKISLYFPDAFVSAHGPSTFADSSTAAAADDSYSGSIKVPATATYVKAGSSPTNPGPEVTKPVGGKIYVQVQCWLGLGAVTTEATPFTVGASKAISVKAKPAISGTPKVGKKLKASKGTWSPKPTSYAYQWLRGSKTIAGKKGTKRAYKVVTADKGKKLRVKVTAKRSGYAPATVTSKAVKIKK